jgi:hypothetical protein
MDTDEGGQAVTEGANMEVGTHEITSIFAQHGQSFQFLCTFCQEQLDAPFAGSPPEHQRAFSLMSPCECIVHTCCLLEFIATDQIQNANWTCIACSQRVQKYISYSRRTKGWMTNIFPRKMSELSNDNMEKIAKGDVIYLRVSKHTIGLAPLMQTYLHANDDLKGNNAHVSITMHKGGNSPDCIYLDAIVGRDSTSSAVKLILTLMKILRETCIKPASSLMTAPLHSMDDVLRASAANQSLVHSMIFNLISGFAMTANYEDLIKLPLQRQKHQLTAFAIVEMILKAVNSHRPGGDGLQKFLSETLEVTQAKPVTWEILNKFSLTGCRSVYIKNMKDESQPSIASEEQIINFLKETDLNDIDLQTENKFGLRISQFDNLQFKALANIVHTTEIFQVCIPYSKLLQDGVYAASRERPDPTVTVVEYVPNAADYHLFATRNLLKLRQILLCISGIPTVGEMTSASFQVDYHLSLNLPKRLPLKDRSFQRKDDALENDPNSIKYAHSRAVIENLQLNPDEKHSFNHHMEAGNVSSGGMVFADLNNLDTVKLIAKHTVEVSEKALERGLNMEGISPIQLHTGALSIGDGSPSNQILRLQDGKLIPEQSYRMTTPLEAGKVGFCNISGAFHLYLELFRLIGAMFRGSHLQEFVASWRHSTGRQEWILAPGDPNQAEQEYLEYIIAHYVAAARACAKHHEDPAEGVSAEQVNAYMIERAKTYAAVMDVLSCIRWLEVVYMLADTEDTSDAELGSTCQRFAAILCSVTHAIKYMRIITNEQERLALASKAEKLIHALYLYTRPTRHQKRIWSDRMMEWFQKDIRYFLGKVWRVNMRSEVEHVVRNLPELLKRKSQPRRGDQTTPTTSRESLHETPLSNVFKEAYLFIEARQVWGGPLGLESPPLYMKKTKSSVGGAARSTLTELMKNQAFSGEVVNDKHVNHITIGTERVKAYADKFMVPGDRQVERSEIPSQEGVTLSKLLHSQTLVESRKMSAFEKERCVDLAKLYGDENANPKVQGLLTFEKMVTELNSRKSRMVEVPIGDSTTDFEEQHTPSRPDLEKLSRLEICKILIKVRTARYKGRENANTDDNNVDVPEDFAFKAVTPSVLHFVGDLPFINPSSALHSSSSRRYDDEEEREGRGGGGGVGSSGVSSSGESSSSQKRSRSDTADSDYSEKIPIARVIAEGGRQKNLLDCLTRTFIEMEDSDSDSDSYLELLF